MTMGSGDLAGFVSNASFVGGEASLFPMSLSPAIEAFSNNNTFLHIVSFLHAHKAPPWACCRAISPWVLDDLNGPIQYSSVHGEEGI